MADIKTTEIKPGMVVKIHQKIKEKDAKGKDKERIQVFEGTVILTHGGKGPSSTFTIRKIGANDIGVEKIFPVWLPSITKVELVKQLKVRRAKLFYLRDYKKKIREKK